MRPLPELWLSALRAPASFAFAHCDLALVADDEIERLGLITKPDTMNYRTLLPEKRGLFCFEAFGNGEAFPSREDLASKDAWDHVRATRFARIALPVPAIHPLALANCYADVAALFGLDVRGTIENSDEAAWTAFRARLEEPDVAPLLVRSLLVMPPYLRPMIPLDEGRWATSDLNDLYRRVVNRSNRLARLIELGAPPIITNSETRMLYDGLDALFANELRPEKDKVTDPEHRPLVSLWGFAGDDPLEALAEHERHTRLTRKRQTQLAAVRSMGFELHAKSAAISPRVTTPGVPL